MIENALRWQSELDSEGAGVLAVKGECTMGKVATVLPQLQALAARPKYLDLSELMSLDSAGALMLLRALAGDRHYVDCLSRVRNARPEHLALLHLVARKASGDSAALPRRRVFYAWIVGIGERIVELLQQMLRLAAFFGAINSCFYAIARGKRKLRWTSVVHHMERTGLDAVPIVALLCFLVGSVVAFLSATALRDFGAAILTVDIVSVSFLREFGVLLTAILVAGRSGSAFTAEIGSMRSREEVDAIKALALDPIELLVVPRLVALLFMLPALALIAMLAGIMGGVLVGATALDISPMMFLVRMQERTELYYLWLGLLKAPVFAFLIASIGCLEGLSVAGSAESVGRHTTSSVVQSIFLVILFDALFAVVFMQLDL